MENTISKIPEKIESDPPRMELMLYTNEEIVFPIGYRTLILL